MKKARAIKLLLLVGLMVLIFASCAYKPDYLVVTGTGAPNPDKPKSQAKLLAKRAAVEDARRNCMEQIKGVQIDSKTTVEDFITKNDSIRSRVDGYIRGLQPIATRENDDGTVEVDMQIDQKKVKDLVK